MSKRDDDLKYLRDHAKRLRALAEKYATSVTPELQRLAQEIEARIATLENGA